MGKNNTWENDKKPQKTILVIEDEKSLREATLDVLQRKNFLTLSAKNGRDGIEIAFKEHPQLILLDLIMPEMDGMTALQKIREDAWGATVPVIILTNLSAINGNVADDALAHIPTQYLIKSDWKLHDIIKKIENIFYA